MIWASIHWEIKEQNKEIEINHEEREIHDIKHNWSNLRIEIKI